MHSIFNLIKKISPEIIKKHFRKVRTFINNTKEKYGPYLKKRKYCKFNLYYTRGAGLITRIGFGSTNKIYEPELSNRLLEEILDLKKPVLIDIGTNIGLISLFLLSKNQRLKIFGFEPSKIPYNSFKTSLFANNLEERIELRNVAISNKTDVMEFYEHGDQDCSGDGFVNTNRSIREPKVTKVKTITLDQWWLEKNKCNVDIIKIDIEGAELLALKGGVELIKECKPKIFLEISKYNIEAYPHTGLDIFNFIDKTLNYKLHTLNGILCTNKNILKLLESEDTFVATNKK